jgi:hypothetical protein
MYYSGSNIINLGRERLLQRRLLQRRTLGRENKRLCT